MALTAASTHIAKPSCKSGKRHLPSCPKVKDISLLRLRKVIRTVFRFADLSGTIAVTARYTNKCKEYINMTKEFSNSISNG